MPSSVPTISLARTADFMAETTGTIAVPKRQARSRVGNGSAVLAGVDGRSAAMRRYKEILGQLVSDLGGDPSEAQTQIARRAATLAVWAEQEEAALANGGQLDIAAFTTAANTLRRLLSDLGLERRMRDVVPTLDQYLRDKAAGKPASAPV
jgi:hypothetical protein